MRIEDHGDRLSCTITLHAFLDVAESGGVRTMARLYFETEDGQPLHGANPIASLGYPFVNAAIHVLAKPLDTERIDDPRREEG